MVLKKLFGKKDSTADINSLKERFSQVSSNPDAQQSNPQENSLNSPNQLVQIQDTIDASVPVQSVQQPVQGQFPAPQQQFPTQQVPVQQPVQNTPSSSDFGQQPIGMAPIQSLPQQQFPTQQVPVQQPVQSQVSQSQPVTPKESVNQAVDLPSWAVESAGEEIANEISSQPVVGSTSQNKATETLEQIEDKYYDAKLNSLIIDQVKELIEIDNNLNTKIEDGSSEIKKEILEREQLAKKVDQHFEKVKELERNMEKFLGLYEMVTNQFNPFVDKDSSNLFLDEKDTKYENVVVEKPTGQAAPIPSDFTKEVPSQQPIVQPVQQPIQQSPVAQQLPVQSPIQQSVSQSQQSSSWNYCPIHHNIHPSLHFELRDGQKLSSIYDVLAVLEQMDEGLFSQHVNLKQNDFSNWIYKVLGLTDLGQQLDLIKTRPEMIISIRNYIQSKMQQS